MSVFMLQMLVMVFAGKRIWEKTQVPAGARQNKHEKNIGIIATIIWVLSLGYSVFLPFRLGTPWFYTGLLVFIIGLVLLAVSTYDFIVTPADEMITRGSYAFCRNPGYLSTFLICLGSGIAGASWLLILFSVMITLCLHKEILIEERYCLDKYGSSFQEYMNRVPRWIGMGMRTKGDMK